MYVQNVYNAQNVSLLIFLHAFDNVMEKEPSAKFYGVFDYFSRTYEVRKFEKIKRSPRHPRKYINTLTTDFI